MNTDKQRKKIGKILGLTEELGWYLTEGEKRALLQQIIFRIGLNDNHSVMKVGKEWQLIDGDLPF